MVPEFTRRSALLVGLNAASTLAHIPRSLSTAIGQPYAPSGASSTATYQPTGYPFGLSSSSGLALTGTPYPTKPRLQSVPPETVNVSYSIYTPATSVTEVIEVAQYTAEAIVNATPQGSEVYTTDNCQQFPSASLSCASEQLGQATGASDSQPSAQPTGGSFYGNRFRREQIKRDYGTGAEATSTSTGQEGVVCWKYILDDNTNATPVGPQ